MGDYGYIILMPQTGALQQGIAIAKSSITFHCSLAYDEIFKNPQDKRKAS